MCMLQGYQRHLSIPYPTMKPSTCLAPALPISPFFGYGTGKLYEASRFGNKGCLAPLISFSVYSSSSGSQSNWKDENSFGNLSSKATPSRTLKKLDCWNFEGYAGGDLPDRSALTSLEQAIQFQEKEETRLFFCGPPTGDIAEIEAFCRLYRLTEHLHSTVMNALRSYSAIESSSLGPDRGDVSLAEEKVASGIACLMGLLHQGKAEVLGVVPTTRTKLLQEASVDDLPTFARFRKEVRECCKSLEDALESLLPADSDQGLDIQKRMLKLKNACLDAGFLRPEGIPSHADIPNFAPVRLLPSKSARTLYKDEDVSFWRGGNVTDSGLEWLVDKGFKTIVDLREESEQPTALPTVAGGKLKVVSIPIERGSAPSKEQVEEFARLVADAINKPLYLRTRAGVGRASAMVSRWREFVLRAQVQAGREEKVSANGTLTRELELLSVEDVRISQEDALALEIALSRSGSGPFSAKLTSAPQDDSGTDVAVPFELNPASTPGAEVVTSADSGKSVTIKDDFYLSTNVTRNAFEAQRPLNVWSRKAMSKFMKRRKAPAGYVTARMDRATGNLPAASVEKVVNGSIAGPANRWGLAGPGIPRSDSPDISSQQTSQSEQKQQSPSYNKTTRKSNGNARRQLGNSDLNSEKGTESNDNQDVSSSMASSRSRDNGALFRVPGDQGITDEGEEPVSVKGDMCASTTGVVRLQSRKKAEMFLVRTDGYSCTRERVKESTLAFTHPSTQQQMLMWKTPPRTVLLLKKLGGELMQETQEVVAFLYHQEGMNVVVEPEVHDQLARMPGFGFVQTFYSQDTAELHERVDFVVCLGGDGVILHASNLFRNAVPPVVSFNLGSLGFLTSHIYEDHKRDLQAVIHGHENMMTGVYITLRMRLRCELFRNGKALPGKVFDVLNEVVVDRGSNPYLCKIECYEHNHLITKVQADGVIVATPTGSTAYSTAAGGSMVHPNVPCMLFTPICPHSLSFRPVVLPDSALFELKVPGDARNSAWVSFDGKKRQQLSKGDSVQIRMSEHPLPTVNKSNQTDDWFQSLVRCLSWNERLEQRPLYMP